MEEMILLFNLETKEYGKIIVHILEQFGVNFKHIDQKNQNQKVGFLLGIEGYKEDEIVDSFDEEFIIFHQFNEQQTKIILDVFENANIPLIPLKSVTTAKNIEWSAKYLKEEIEKEYQSFNTPKQFA